MISRVKKFSLLPAVEKRIVLLAWERLWYVRVSLWFHSYRKTRVGIDHRIKIQANNSSHSVQAERLVYLVNIASRGVLSTTCLTNALVSEWFLSEAGYEPVFHIGVKKGYHEDFGAHAWVEIDGKDITGSSSGFESIYQN